MKFSIIIPTYKRPEKLKRAVDSVFSQLGDFSVQIIIVNDSPEYEYGEVERYIQVVDTSHSLIYIKNPENKGVNYSRNKALECVDVDTDYVLFLDDDDWFGDFALTDVVDVLRGGTVKWLMTNRMVGDQSLTVCNSGEGTYSFFLGYLIFKKIKGDATHCIARDMAVKARFSSEIKNGEEWFYFIQLPTQITYVPLPTTISEGYAVEGLNAQMQDTYKKNTKYLFKEVKNISMLIYLTMRWVYGIIK